MTEIIQRKYGWKPDKKDHRDRLFLAPMIDASQFPPEKYIGDKAPAPMDQGHLGSCTGHGISGAFRTARIIAGLPDRSFSRLQLYFDERELEQTIDEDAGAEIRDGIKCLSSTGIAPEELWPYDISKFTVRPTKDVYESARLDVALSYERVNVSVNDIKAALVADHPVIIGISIFPEFESQIVAETGIVPMPTSNEQPLGGHCMYVVGYGQKPGYFTVRNSWGPNWGDKGDCYIPEDYLGNPNFGSDYWIIKTVKSI